MPMPSRRGFLALSASLFGTTLASANSQVTSTAPSYSQTPFPPPAPPTDMTTRHRPLIHFSPAQGFMNDPNGLILVDGVYHLFFQYNPAAAVPGNVYWGHATSHDLIAWEEQAIALAPNERGQVFSGSMVWDRDNTSGLFADQPGGLVALFTRAGQAHQTQDVAYGPTDASSLTPYDGNPVLDIGSASFRDPKVFWHAATQRWIMAVALARSHEISFYASPDLLNWHLAGTFSQAGILGLDYECPDLIELPVESGGTRWVLFLSINPGAPTGGSAVQFFVGHFDGQAFHPDDEATRLVDNGQDFYALQTFANTPGRTVGLAWMNNWLYSSDIPAYPTRGAMTLPRTLSLRQRGDHWHIVQRFPDLAAWQSGPGLAQTWQRASGPIASLPWPEDKALELQASGELTPGSRMLLRISNEQGERLDAGLDQNTYPGFFVDRSRLSGFEHPFWHHKAIHSILHDFTRFDCHIVVDRCSIELLGMEGEAALTLLHFFKFPPTLIEVSVENGVWLEGKLDIRQVSL